MNDRTQRTIAVCFSVLMVTSVVAMAAVGAEEPAGTDVSTAIDGPAASADVPNVASADGTSVGDDARGAVGAQSASDETRTGGANASAYVDPALERTGGTQQVLITLADADVSPRTSEAVAVEHLRRQAERTQAPVLDRLETMRGVTPTNSFWITNAIVADVDTGVADLDALASTDGVEALLLSRDVMVPEPEAGASEDDEVTYGLEQIRAPEVWNDFGVRGDGARVAVIDNGIDPSHPDLDLYTENESDPTYPGGFAVFDGEGQTVEGLEPESSEGDAAGHGDHTSGTVAADPGDDADVPAYGVAPHAELLHADVFRLDGTDATVIAAMEWAAERDADAASLSLGFGCTDFFDPQPVYIDSLLDPIDNLRAAGTVPVVSTGNAGEGCVGAPGSHWDAFGIGATDEGESVTSFSSGDTIAKENWDEPPAEWPDTYVKPDVVAPGYNVFSAGPDGSGYTEMSGTSMSAPHVSGAVALLRSMNADATVDEIETALEETARKPDDWPEPDDERDTRYGLGIVDVRAAADEIGGEFTVGDADRDGDVTFEDVRLTHQYALGIADEADLNANLADANRDGEVTFRDVIVVHRQTLGIGDAGGIEVTSLEVPEEVDGGDAIEVSATIENAGDLGVLDYVDLRLAEAGSDLGEEAVVDSEFVDVAVDGVDDPAGRPAESTIEFAVETDDLPGADYAVGVFSSHDGNESELTVRKPVFEVTDVEADPEVDRGDSLPVTVGIENTGNAAGERDVEYRLENHLDETQVELVAENVTLEAGASTDVEFTVETDDLDGGEYEHVATTPADEGTLALTVREAHFAVTDVEGPDGIFVGDAYDATATIENVGDAPAEQVVDYRLGAARVGVVDVADGDEQGREIAAVLAEDPRFDVDVVHARNATDATDEYDAFVIQRFGSEEVARAFLDDLGGQGVVYLGSFQGTSSWEYPDGVARLAEIRENPGTVTEVSSDADDDPAVLEIGAEHPIFEGIGDPGETVETYQTRYSGSWGAWFDDYDGEVLGDVDLGNGHGGPAVAVGDEGTEALVTAAAWTGVTEWTADEADRLLSNAVEYVATGDVTPTGPAATDVSSEPVRLEPGEEATVTFEHAVPDDHPTGDALHLVRTDHDVGGDDVQIRADDYFEVVDFEAPETVEQTETFAVSATVENNGHENGTQDVSYRFDGTVVDVAEGVSLPVGESTTLEFEHTVDDYETPGNHTHGVETELDEDVRTVEVLEIDDADFRVTIDDAPESAGQQDEIVVDATVTNAGDRTDTQTLAYEFVPLDVSVAVVDDDPSTHGVDAAAADLDARLGDSHDVETFDASRRDLLDEMDDYDVFVVNHFADTDVGAFLDALEDDQGAVYVDSWHESANAINELADARGDPSGVENNQDGSAPLFYEIVEEHPIFDGVGEQGDDVDVSDEINFRTTFDGYDGTLVGEIGAGIFLPDPGVGVNDDENEVLLGGHGLTEYSEYDVYTDDAHAILANAVGHVSEQTIADGAAATLASTETTTREVTLEGGANESVTFTTEIPLSAGLGDYDHVVSSANDTATSAFEIDEAVTAIRGTVTDRETGDPIANATVSIDGDGYYEAETDENGEYFREIAFEPDEDPKHFVVSADAEGYRSEAVVTLEYDDVADVDFELDAIAGDLSGEVTDADTGDPVAGATVYDADGDAFAVETGENGTYVASDLAAGTYAVRTDAPGYERSGLQFVTIEDGDERLDVNLTPVAEVTIENQTVVDAVTVASAAYHGDDFAVALYDGPDPATADRLGSETVAAGAHENVTVPLEEEFAENETVHAVLATVDDGGVGEPITRDGAPVADEATLSPAAPANYEVTILETDDPVVEGEDLDVSAAVANAGDLAGNQTVALEIDGSLEDETALELDAGEDANVTLTWSTSVGDAGNATATVATANDTDDRNVTVQAATDVVSVAVVDNDPSTHGVDDAAADLDSTLGSDYDVETFDASQRDLLDEMDDYDVLVVNHFGGTNASDFLDALGDDQGVVYIDAEDDGANSITELSDARGNPTSVTNTYSQQDITYRITQNHSVFDGVGEVDDDVVLHTDLALTYFSGYDGDVFADVGGGIDFEGPGVGVDDSANEVLLGSLGLSDWAPYEEFTDDAKVILANAVEHVDAQRTDAVATTERTADERTEEATGAAERTDAAVVPPAG